MDQILAMMVFTFSLGQIVSIQVNKILDEMKKVDKLESEECDLMAKEGPGNTGLRLDDEKGPVLGSAGKSGYAAPGLSMVCGWSAEVGETGPAETRDEAGAGQEPDHVRPSN